MLRRSLVCVAVVLSVPLALAAPGMPFALAGPTAPVRGNEAVYAVDADGDGAAALVLRDLRSGQVRQLLPEDPAGGVDYLGPQLSPDGERIALTTNLGSEGGAVFAVAVVERDGSGFRRVTEPAGSGARVEDLFPTWSPDGQTLAFSRITVSGDGTVDSEIRTVGAGQTLSAGEPVPGAENGFTVDWDPAGGRLVFSDVSAADAAAGRLTSGQLTTVGLDGSGRTSLGVTGALPAWSPDGLTIAYTTITERDPDPDRAADIEQIALVPAAGLAPEPTANATATATVGTATATVLAATWPGPARTSAAFASWSPDGESLLYELWAYDDEGTPLLGDLWAVDRAGVRAGKITATTADERGAHLQGPPPPPVGAAAPSTFTPVTARRVLDTRREGWGKLDAGDEMPLWVAGLVTSAGPVPAEATAVVLQVTANGATAPTEVTVAASRQDATAGTLVAARGEPGAAQVTVTLDPEGQVLLRNSAGRVHLTADLVGFYTADSRGSGLTVVRPYPLLLTRGTTSVLGPALADGAADLQVSGELSNANDERLSVPADATAVVLALSGTVSGQRATVQLGPASGRRPGTALEVTAGRPAATLATVAVGDGGRVRLSTIGGPPDVAVYLTGYYAPSSKGRFVPVPPTRWLDTRDGTGAAPIPVTADAFVDLRVAGVRGVPRGAVAALLSMTAVDSSLGTSVRAYPADAARPTLVSSLRVPAGRDSAAPALVHVGANGRVRLRNDAGSLHLIADLTGYVVEPAVTRQP